MKKVKYPGEFTVDPDLLLSSDRILLEEVFDRIELGGEQSQNNGEFI